MTDDLDRLFQEWADMEPERDESSAVWVVALAIATVLFWAIVIVWLFS